LKGTSWSGNTSNLPRTSDNHAKLAAHALPRSGFVLESGFGSLSTFYEAFQKRFKEKPVQYSTAHASGERGCGMIRLSLCFCSGFMAGRTCIPPQKAIR
jgi:hypothetical protein